MLETARQELGSGRDGLSCRKEATKQIQPSQRYPVKQRVKRKYSSFCPPLVLQSCINACHWPNCLKARGSQQSQRQSTESEECHSLRNGAESKKAQDQQGPNHISCPMSSLVSAGCSLSVKLYPCGRHVLLLLFEVWFSL